MKTFLILAGAALLATGGIATAQSAGGAGSDTTPGAARGARESVAPGIGAGTVAAPGGVGRPNGSVTPPGVTTGLSGANDAATNAGRPAPTSQAPLASGAKAGPADVPASPEPAPPVGGSVPN
jgi:hypothetical protein